MNVKKILIMVPSLGMGGMEKMLVNVSNALTNEGYDVTVMNLYWHNDSLISLFDNRVKYFSNVNPKKFFFSATKKDIFQKKFRILPFKLWMKIHSSKYLHNCYIKDNYDVEIAFYTGYCVKIIDGCPKNSKKIFWLHGEAWLMDGMIQGYFTRKKAESVYKNFDQIICVSKHVEEDFINRFGKDCNITTIQNILPIEYIKTKAKEPLDIIKKNKFTLISVGRLDNNNKGFDRLLWAVNRLVKEGYLFDLWIIGEGHGFNYLSKYIKKHNLVNVSLLGLQNNPYKFIKNADLLVCASRFEGFGLVVAESLILEIPVLSTNVTGPAEILDNGKYGMVVENSTDGIYDGIKKILIDESVYAFYKKATRERINFFNKEKIIQQIEKIL